MRSLVAIAFLASLLVGGLGVSPANAATITSSMSMQDDYPWKDRALDSGYSPLRYYYKNCTDFVAWRLNRQAGVTSSPWRYTWSNLTPNGGHAYQWKDALSGRYPVNRTPALGAVAWWGSASGGGYGHVAIVSQIWSDGTVTVEEYNHIRGAYSNRHLTSATAPEAYIHVQDVAPQGTASLAFQANTGRLWTVGNQGAGDLGYGMMAGTSPSVATVSGYNTIAFQANTGKLWTVGHRGWGDRGLGMRSGTSPSITAVNGGYQVAFQANTGRLWTVGDQGTGDLGYGMMAGTSPSIANVGGNYTIAFQANTGNLWVVGHGGVGDTGLGMKAGTSPSITAVSGGYQVAFQANTGHLWTFGPQGQGSKNWGLGMMVGTSPSAR